MKFTVETHRHRDGGFVGQVLLAGVVVYEEGSPATAQQAAKNAAEGFAYVVKKLVEQTEAAALDD